VLPALASVVPGVLLHGSGAFAAGDRKLARRLLRAEGIGAAAFLGAGSLLALSGASRRVVSPLLPVVIAGGGVFLLSFMADVYAATTGGRAAESSSLVPLVEAELGYRYVYDPQFAYRNFAYVREDTRLGAFRLSPSLWLALDDGNQRANLDVAYRLLGRTRRRSAADGAYLDAASGLTYHHHADERFAVLTPEFRLDGRYDLARISPSLRGAFAEGHLGAGLEFYDFDVPGTEMTNDAYGLLLARFGFGVYFGGPDAPGGEALLYYDHRHDDFAAGLGVRGIGGGVLGHFGLSGHYYVTRCWGVSGLSEIGSAFVVGASLRYRQSCQREADG
jgi:hypothetical protein